MGLVSKCIKLLRLQQHFDNCPEQEVINYLRSWNSKLQMDDYGNLYLINPGTPLLCAHMDTVQRIDDASKVSTIKNRHGIISGDNIIIGGDDKCGIAIAMQVYEKMGDKVSLLFTRQEEVGCVGASKFCDSKPDLIKMCRYCLVLDRKDKGDIIGYQNQYCSKEFEDRLHNLIKDFGYKPVQGLSSDTRYIGKLINAVNLSVGYYNPHSKSEFIDIEDLDNAYNAVMYVVMSDFNPKCDIYKAPKVAYSRKNYTFSNTYSNSYNKDLFETTKLKDYFRVNANGQLVVRKDVLIWNDNDNECYELIKGKYNVEDIEGYNDTVEGNDEGRVAPSLF